MMDSASKEDTILQGRGVSLNFGGLWAVKDLNLHIRRGQITGLIGPNGSGKTTLLNLISGFLKPVTGSIFLEGSPIHGLPPYKVCELGICRTFQIPQLFGEVSVLENVMVGRHSRAKVGKLRASFGLPSARQEDGRIKEVALQILQQVGLVDSIKEQAASLPFGKKRLLEIARALASVPMLLLLDEPTGGLSPVEAKGISEVIVSLKERGLTILLVEHNMPVLMGISDHVIVMSEGRKVFEGAPQAVQNDEKVLEVYLGSRWGKSANS